MSDATTSEGTKVTVGLDLGDRHSQVWVLDEAGEVIEEARLGTKPQALRRRFCGAERLRLGGKARLLDDLTGFVKNAHLDVAVAEIETYGHLRSLAGGSITHGSASFFGPAEPGSSWGSNGTPRE